MGRVAVSDFPAVGVAQAAELTGLSKDAIRGRIRRGGLASSMHEGRHSIPLAELHGRGLVVEGERYTSALERAESLQAELSVALASRERAQRELHGLQETVRLVWGMVGQKERELLQLQARSGIRWPWRRSGPPVGQGGLG
jgi:hypothetical protein